MCSFDKAQVNRIPNAFTDKPRAFLDFVLDHYVTVGVEETGLVNPCKHGANGRNRTDDLLITSELLYQLSYVGLQTDELY